MSPGTRGSVTRKAASRSVFKTDLVGLGNFAEGGNGRLGEEEHNATGLGLPANNETDTSLVRAWSRHAQVLRSKLVCLFPPSAANLEDLASGLHGEGDDNGDALRSDKVAEASLCDLAREDNSAFVELLEEDNAGNGRAGRCTETP